ncbi:hypothetical protein M441DRAFT_83183 [Trichoderma asperellum CBS 433.97]|uniref:Tyrosinase copper-binding domain-containing protein n=1 Tax=Trichoderma asperellum (strain ATCC 204424 / CBS 433.97 / NBRC 101777) TaxID=1042311 RepID=A0A2T3YXJ6_TRIA4|nr:hypothetical protein M441DRAFT_83183 [Trichoderma asperellum CBS 433.97]PTB37276.1 hypothetical protein M441DRAFT_83183 [Trichoderma asperellum CBS 433.97]
MKLFSILSFIILVKKLCFRREYGSLSKAERLDYIKAVKYLQSLPSRSPASVVPGARSRYDGFVAAHIQHALTIHLTGNFLTWHRWPIHEYERALREECDCKDYRPPTFANMTFNLGPGGSVAYNPRRFTRDIGLTHTTRFANYTSILEGVPSSTEAVGPHIAAHTTIGGDPGADVFASPGDPAFYVHHEMVDRVWTLRSKKLGGDEYGNITWPNTPHSRETMLSDILDLGYASEPIQIADVMGTLFGPFYYFRL